jgi:hypothetical protein
LTYKDQSRVWRTAAKRKDDGWRPARSKVAAAVVEPELAAAPVRAPLAVQALVPETPVRRIVVRELPVGDETRPRRRSRPVVTWWPAERSFEGGFWRRLERARESLDDFADSRIGRSG